MMAKTYQSKKHTKKIKKGEKSPVDNWTIV